MFIDLTHVSLPGLHVISMYLTHVSSQLSITLCTLLHGTQLYYVNSDETMYEPVAA